MLHRISPPPIIWLMGVSFVVLAAACDETTRQNPYPPGHCEYDTIIVGGSFFSADPVPADAFWIAIEAVFSPGTELYRELAEELGTVLDTLGITTLSRSEIIHIAKGPCWPPYTLAFTVTADSSAIDSLHETLLATPLAGYPPYAVRETYGKFFITCGWGSSDLWTVWYR